MQTKQLYYDQRDLDECAVTILAKELIDGRPALLLDATLLYPEGGGQPSDRGWINTIPIEEVQILSRGGAEEIYHFIATDAQDAGLLSNTTPAILRLDRAWRQDYSIQHTAQHLVSATILRLTGAPTVSMHLGSQINTIDVERPSFDSEELACIEDAVLDLIQADLPVLVHYCPPEDIAAFPLRKRPPEDEPIVRIIEIDGYDYSPCGGLHCTSTGELHSLAILGSEKYKGMSRISFIAGRRVAHQYRALRSTAGAASRSLKVPPDTLAQGVQQLLDRTAVQDRQLLLLKEQLAALEARSILSAAGPAGLVLHLFTDRSMEDALRVGRALQTLTDRIVLVASQAEMKAALLTRRSQVDLRPVCKDLFSTYGGAGGGGPSFYQGAFHSVEQLKAFITGVQQHEYFH
ncbi:MAG: alanyl-tRNA editing protein [Termitinemataceae bacterium]